LRAGEALPPGNPYAAIAARNVFDIHPPPPVDPNAQPPAPPPPKITLNGIISAVGHVQALFKVAIPAKPGQPAKEQSYILGEGEAQDEIEVAKIDEKGGLVTFNNHGTEQELPLTAATASGSPAPAPAAPAAGPGPGPRPGFPRPGFPPAGGPAGGNGFIRFGQPGGTGAQTPTVNNANNTPVNRSSGLGVAIGGASGSFGQQSGQQFGQQNQTRMSADDQQVMMTAYKVTNPDMAKILPPSVYDSEAGIPPTPGADGSSSQ